ncbi:MAG: hypothetical protein AAF724_11460 [Pseudomonadota bacterium]
MPSGSTHSRRNATHQIQRLARNLATLTAVGMILLPLTIAAVWIFPQWLSVMPTIGAVSVDLTETSLLARILALATQLIGVSILIYGLAGLRQTFHESARGYWFSARSIAGFRRFAWVSLAMVFVGVFQNAVLTAVVSAGTPGMPNQMSISFGSADLAKLFSALLFVFVAQIFVAGKAIDDENASFI